MRRIAGVVAVAGLLLLADDGDPGEVASSTPSSEPVGDEEPRAASRSPGAPVFVVGFQRSGTSLLRAMLDEHPQLALSTDSQFIPRFWQNRARYQSDGRVDARRLVADVLLLPRVREWGLPESAIAARLDELEDPTLSEALAVVFRAYADTKGKPIWGDKTPGYVLRIPLLGSLFPAARFVHVIRDGRDATISCLRRGVVVHNFARGADLWVQRVGRGRSAGRALGPRRYLEVRYEDLVSDPTTTLTGVCDFLELPFDERMLGYTERALSDLPERVRYRHDNLAKPPTPGLRDWRTDMSPSDLAVFQAIGGRLLDELGYERGVARIPVSARLTAWRQVASARTAQFGRVIGAKARGKSPVEFDRA
jgi:hypothetical protein